MINELYQLSEAMKDVGAEPVWHRMYNPLPNISAKAPCVQVTISGGRVLELSPVSRELGSLLRRYGMTSKGFYPGMNLAPLYQVADEDVREALKNVREHPETLELDVIQGWCARNNWDGAFRGKYEKSMRKVPAELSSLVPDFEPLQILIEESGRFPDASDMHRELEQAAFAMLAERRDVSLALDLLFSENPGSDKLSVVLDTPRLIERGMPAVSRAFVLELNAALLAAEASKTSDQAFSDVDAFGVPFHPLDDPMPEVKLAGGLSVKLRTMFEEQRCQARYGRLESASYPLSAELRKKLQSSLAWIGKAERENQTWISIGPREILFAYPSRLPDPPVSYVNSFAPGNVGKSGNDRSDATFTACAKRLVSELRHGRDASADPAADRLLVFVLKGLDKGRTKIVYTRQTDANELERRCEAWTLGCENLPPMPRLLGRPGVLFPLRAADVLNSFWKRDGEQATSSFRPVPRYHGLELLLDAGMPVSADLHLLAEQAMALGPCLGDLLARVGIPEKKEKPKRDNKQEKQLFFHTRDMLPLTGLLLARTGIRKETYMENLPYLFGQLLKISDMLHALYCVVMRDGYLPTQLAGSGIYPSAAEAPIRALHLLGMRMNPYIAWAKTYSFQNVTDKGKESWRAIWLLSLYERIAARLYAAWTPELRFGDAEKAQFFLGYLAELPKKERGAEQTPDESIDNKQETNREGSEHE